MFTSITAFFTALRESFTALSTCKEHQSETDLLKTKKSKSKAVNYAEQMVFYVESKYPDIKNDRKYARLRKLFFKYN